MFYDIKSARERAKKDGIFSELGIEEKEKQDLFLKRISVNPQDPLENIKINSGMIYFLTELKKLFERKKGSAQFQAAEALVTLQQQNSPIETFKDVTEKFIKFLAEKSDKIEQFNTTKNKDENGGEFSKNNHWNFLNAAARIVSSQNHDLPTDLIFAEMNKILSDIQKHHTDKDYQNLRRFLLLKTGIYKPSQPTGRTPQEEPEPKIRRIEAASLQEEEMQRGG